MQVIDVDDSNLEHHKRTLGSLLSTLILPHARLCRVRRSSLSSMPVASLMSVRLNASASLNSINTTACIDHSRHEVYTQQRLTILCGQVAQRLWQEWTIPYKTKRSQAQLLSTSAYLVSGEFGASALVKASEQ